MLPSTRALEIKMDDLNKHMLALLGEIRYIGQVQEAQLAEIKALREQQAADTALVEEMTRSGVKVLVDSGMTPAEYDAYIADLKRRKANGG